MAFYPINIDLKDKLCVVIGGGNVAERKVRGLVSFGASVRVVSPGLTEGLSELARSKRIEHVARGYLEGDLEGALLAFAASDDSRVNEAACKEAAREGMLVNVADRPGLCSFIVPSIVKRGDLVLSVSTSGAFPLLAGKLKRELEEVYGPEYGRYLVALSEARRELKKTGKGDREKLAALLDAELLALAEAGKDEELRERITERGHRSRSQNHSR